MRSLLSLIVLTSFLIFSGIIGRDLVTRGEAREAIAAQSILDGHWILPIGYGGKIASKPPLMHWMAAFSAAVAGQDAISGFFARFPSALASIVFVGCFFLFVRKRVNQDVAWLTSIILVTSFEWLRAATSCRVDLLLAAFVGGAILQIFCWTENSSKKNLIIAGIFSGLGVLVKGPVAIVLPTLICGSFLLVEKKFSLKSFVDGVWFIVPALVVGGLWYALALLKGGAEFWNLVYYENGARFLSTMEDEPHKHGFLYLIGVLLLGTLPWVFALGAVGFAGFKSGAISLSGFWSKIKSAWSGSSPLWRYFAISALVILVFFAIPSSKRGVYLLPMYPFLAFFFAQVLLNWMPLQKFIRIACVAFFIGNIGLTLGTNLASLRSFAGDHVATLPPESRIFSFGEEFYSVSLYARRMINRAPKDFQKDDLVLVAGDKVAALSTAFSGRTFSQIASNEWWFGRSGSKLVLLKVD